MDKRIFTAGDYMDSEVLVAVYFEKMKEQFGDLTNFYKFIAPSSNGGIPSLDEINEHLYPLAVFNYNLIRLNYEKLPAPNEKAIKMALRRKLVDLVEEQRVNMLAAVANKGTEDLRQLRTFLQALTNSEPSEVDVAVLAHFCWQVKRKLSNKKVTYHIMPVLYGENQGTGKSTAIHMLCSVFKPVVISETLATITDERRHLVFNNNYVCFVDELAGGDRSQIENIKRIITADILTVRLMHTNSARTINQNVTFIGTSNKELSEMIRDNHMRRFWQIDVNTNVNFELINTVNFKELWEGIDENREEPYILPYLKEVKEIQQSYTTKSAFEQFAEANNLLANPNEVAMVEMRATDLFRAYMEYCKEINDYAGARLTNSSFGKKMSKLGVQTIRKRAGMYYLVPSQFASLQHSSTQVNLVMKGLVHEQ